MGSNMDKITETPFFRACPTDGWLIWINTWLV